MIKKKILSNNITIYILNDSFFKNVFVEDLVIKIDNFGTFLDIKNKIYGAQHLLEHAIFENYKNLNVYYNASTTFEDMSFELFFSKDYKNTDDPSIKFIKKCFFKNNDFTKIDFSRNLSEKEIEQYINELDAEYIYRNNLSIPWNLKSLLFSNEDIIYMGGNKTSFLNKIEDLKKYLKEPDVINTDEISIFLKKSKINYLPQIESIFSQIKPVKKSKFKIKLNLDKFYNKIFKINNTNTNQISFILYKKDFNNNFDILYIISFLYPFFYFSITYLEEIFITFYFDDIFNLFSFFNILKYCIYKKLSLTNYKDYIALNINYFDINKYLSDFIKEYFFSFNDLTYKDCYDKFEKQILFFFKFLSQLIKEKKYFLNTTKDYIFNKTTNISLEKYSIFETNIIEEYFLNKKIENFNVEKYIYSKYLKINKLKCFNKILIINKNDNFVPDIFSTFSFEVKNGQIIKYQNNSNKLSFLIYINSLILFFSNPVFNTYKECIETLIKNKNLESFIKSYYKDINIKFSKKNFLIKTGYEFMFCVVKLNKKYLNKINFLVKNIENYLKTRGITYYLEIVVIHFEKFSLIFFFTQTDKDKFKKFYNVIKNIFDSNYIKNEMVYVLSEKSYELNFDSLNKFVKFII